MPQPVGTAHLHLLHCCSSCGCNRNTAGSCSSTGTPAITSWGATKARIEPKKKEITGKGHRKKREGAAIRICLSSQWCLALSEAPQDFLGSTELPDPAKYLRRAVNAGAAAGGQRWHLTGSKIGLDTSIFL